MDREYNFVAEDRKGTYIREHMPPEAARKEYRDRGYVSQKDASECKNRIKEHRLRAGMSLAMVAKVTGQHVTTVARHETRTHRIPANILEIYSQLYNVDIKRLLVWDDTI